MSNKVVLRSPVKKVGYTDIAALLGVGRKHVVDRLSKRPDFPAPVLRISSRTVWWEESDILAWASKQAQRG